MPLKEKTSPKFLSNGGKMGNLIRNYDWSHTTVGHHDDWPQSLRTTLGIVLESKLPMQLYWGEDLIVFYNDAFRQGLVNAGKHLIALGQKASEVWGANWDITRKPIEQAMAGSETTLTGDQLAGIFGNGKMNPNHWKYSFTPVYSETGNVGAVLVLCTETTASLHSTGVVQISEQRFQNLVRDATVGIVVLSGEEMRVDVVNEAYGRLIDLKSVDIIGKPLFDLIPDAEAYFRPLLTNVRLSGKPLHLPGQAYSVVTNGKRIEGYLDVVYQPYREIDGTITGVMALCQDVTEAVTSRNKIKESEQQVRAIVESAPFPIGVYTGKEMRIQLANQTMLDTWGKGNNVIGKLYAEILPELDNQSIFKQLDDVFTTGIAFHAKNQRVDIVIDGKLMPFYFNYSFTPLFDGAGSVYGVINTAADVTDLNVAKQKIEESEERARLATESANLGTFDLNLITRDLIASPRFSEIFGLPVQVTPYGYAAAVHPDYLEVQLTAYKEALSTGTLLYEAKVLHPDGTEHWVQADGKVYYDEQQNPTRLLGTLQDITEQKNIQQQKDNFIAMASHELKTPVTSIKIYTQLVADMLSTKGDTEEAHMLDRMNIQIDRLTNLISDLLNITRINSGKLVFHKSPYDFNQLISEMIEELQRTTTTHRIVLSLGQPVSVLVDKDRIGQVVTNLISNALKYSPWSKEINVSTTVASGEVIFSVQDFGIGIEKQSQEKVFEQFYRVNNDQHQSFPGLGLGLYISSEIIKREGGRIWVESVEGEGSRFYFSLPCANN